MYGSRAGQNSRFWTGQRDPLQTSIHRLCVNQMVRILSVNYHLNPRSSNCLSPVRQKQKRIATTHCEHDALFCVAIQCAAGLFEYVLCPGTELQRSCSGRLPTALLLTCGLWAASWRNSTLSDLSSPETVKWMRSLRSAKSLALSKR